jgi:hypothetical protein
MCGVNEERFQDAINGLYARISVQVKIQPQNLGRLRFFRTYSIYFAACGPWPDDEGPRYHPDSHSVRRAICAS